MGTKGSFFEAPDWVDKEKKPGHTSQTNAITGNVDWFHIFTGKFFLYSPNFVWGGIALFVYFMFPYDLKSDLYNEFKFDWMLKRWYINFAVTFGYFGFWHVSLYRLMWGQRKFKPDNMPTAGRMLHNCWYSFLGTIQWTVWEAIFLHCYSTGKLPYLSDDNA